MTPTTELATSFGRVSIVHRRLPGAKLTVCGHPVKATLSLAGGRRPCIRCEDYLVRLR